MKKIQNLLFTLVLLLIANLCFSQDLAEKGSSKNQIDTDSISSLNLYIEDHTEQLNIKIIVSNNQLKYLLPYENGKSASVKTDLSICYGFRLTYKNLSARVRIRPKLSATYQENKGNTDHFTFGFDVLKHKWAHFFEYSYRRGYYIDNTNFITGEDLGNFHVQLPNLTTNIFNGVSQYKFNKNYSIKAVEYYNEIQLKSAGTFMPGINYTYYTFKDANKEILGDGSIGSRNPYNDYKGFSLIIEPGYYYTFVLDKYFFVNVFAAPGVGVDFYNDKEFDTVNNTSTDENYSRAFLSFKTGASIGYNRKQFYFGSEFKYQVFNKKEISLQPSKTIFQVFVGYRFKAPKQVSKPLDYIEDKVLGLKKRDNN
ncbi:MAG: DUF4421 family protein [Flavobacteriaceae bacterium]|jgi:hypothetical protein|nr:DUF4421 family protein [Flavobacteriaceae bacterium]